jgi:exosortase
LKEASIRRPFGFIGVSACALLAIFVWSYWPTLCDLVAVWADDPDYSHGFLVIPLAIGFLWLRRDRIPAGEIRPSFWGLTLIAAAAALRVAGTTLYLKPMEGWSILLWAAGAAWLLGGSRLLWYCLPSIAFLFFMVPLPYRVSHWLSLPLQRTATVISSWMLQCLGQPALAEGNTILLGDQLLEVERACSGLRIFFGVMALAFAYVIATRRSWWEKALLLASAAPIALAANSIRIVSTGLLYKYVSAEASSQFSHDFAGWVMIPLAALMFAFLLWFLGRLLPPAQLVDVRELVARNRA